MRIMDVDNEIFNLTLQQKNAEEELKFIETHVSTNENETSSSGDFDSVLRDYRLLDLTNTIKVNKLMIENQKKRKDIYLSLEQETDEELKQLNRDLNELKEEQLLAKNINYLKIGNIETHTITNEMNKKLIFAIFIIIGLILTFFLILLKEEYMREREI